MTAAEKLQLSYADYLALEAKSVERHEFIAGEVFAMAGGTIEHARLQGAIARELGTALSGKPCNVYSSDLRIRVTQSDRATYADVVVICGKAEASPDDPNAVLNPIVIVEVVSETSEAYDRGDKFIHYRRIPSLQEYVLVSQKARRIEVYRRAGTEWVLSESEGAGEAKLPSIGVVLHLDDVYRDPTAA
ncbi:MAG: Uma2 family endonuclease [Deltaproteobacteria bacterium]|nr:Uma2 family endonuclease [Deltaproteobacteria bacterium]